MTHKLWPLILSGFAPDITVERFEITEVDKDAYRGLVGAGFNKKEAAYQVCKSHPHASKLSSNKRKEWQQQLINEVTK